MDTDYLPSASIFAAFLLLFCYLSLVHRPDSATNITPAGSRPPRWYHSIIAWLKYACVIAAALSGLALVHSTVTDRWLPAAFLGLGLLSFLAAIDLLTGALARRQPARSTALQRLFERMAPGTNGDDRVLGQETVLNSSEVSHLGSVFSARPEPEITREDLVGLDHRDREMLRSILRLDVTTAREIMTPRLDVVAVEGGSKLDLVSQMMTERGHSRLPVYEETIDSILGIVYARDVMAAMANQILDQNIRDLIRPAFIIPETKRLDELLEELQDKGVQMAIVVDEYGGTEGVVTMEDVLEEIVGEIEDEFSRTRESLVVKLPDGGAMVDAGITTENVEQMFGSRIDATDVDTVGGFVYHSLGKIPQVGDVVITGHLRIEVISILGRRLRKLRIDRIDANGSEDQSQP